MRNRDRHIERQQHVEQIVRARLKKNIDRLTHLSEEDRATLLEQEVQKSMSELENAKPPDRPLPGMTFDGFVDSEVEDPDFA